MAETRASRGGLSGAAQHVGVSSAVNDQVGPKMRETPAPVEHPNRTALILYGTETGNSQDLAEDLSRRLRRIHFSATLQEMDQTQLSTLLKYTLVVFVLATTGQGEMPRNARLFWRSLLRKRLSPTSLQRLQFATFGLGDSKYLEFNFAVRKLRKRLCQLGASAIVDAGEADEQHPEGTDATFLPWANSLQAFLLAHYPLPEGVLPIPDDVLLPPLYALEVSHPSTMSALGKVDETEPSSLVDRFMARNNGSSGATVLDDNSDAVDENMRAYLMRRDPTTALRLQKDPRLFDTQVDCGNMVKDHPEACGVNGAQSIGASTPRWTADLTIPKSWILEIIDITRVTDKAHWQDVRAVRLLIWPKLFSNGEEKLPALPPGSTIALFPQNYPEDVQRLIELMGWEEYADRTLSFRSEKSDGTGNLMGRPPGVYPKKPTFTLRDLLTYNMDITAIPKRSFFEQIKFWTDDQYHKDRLVEFTDPNLIDEFFDYTSRPRRSMLEVLEEFDSVKIPLEYVATVFPPIRARHYSVFEQEECHEGLIVTLLVAMVKYKTVLQKTREGLCSRFIRGLKVPNRIPAQMGEGPGWRIPYDVPVIAIATGTGVAPIHFFFRARAEFREDVKFKPTLTDLLFFGCRHPHHDDLVGHFDESWSLVGTGALKIRKAFSRWEKSVEEGRRYVQDLLRGGYKREISDILLNPDSRIIICGSSGNMPKAVRAALIDIAVTEGHMSVDAATKWVKGRILEEVW